ncbi:hypothetical protein [Methanolobus sp. WCC5]|uniref:hypothetical protein n=1 Tax=Methanolobus sp. WCC5 TaxID=3125785 RepID=UPI003243B5BB
MFFPKNIINPRLMSLLNDKSCIDWIVDSPQVFTLSPVSVVSSPFNVSCPKV